MVSGRNGFWGFLLAVLACVIAAHLPATATSAAEQPSVAPAPPPPAIAVPGESETVAPAPRSRSTPPTASETPRSPGPRQIPPSTVRPSVPPQTLPSTSTPSLDQFAMRTRGTPSLRLAGVPNMLGDLGVFSLQAKVDTNMGEALVDLPLAAAGLRAKISENNKALPMDRVYFQYNHFHNAVANDFDTSTVGDELSSHLDRYTIGLEKTFHEGLWSVDLRIPFAPTQSLTSPGLTVSSGDVGNLTVIVKRLLASGPHGALATGMGINTPTGSDVYFQASRQYWIDNEAVHLSPFLGSLYQPNDCLFYQGFLEVDVPLNGNSLRYDNGSGPVYGGILTEQTLMKVDLSAGYWFYRNPRACLNGLASILEFHYMGTLNDGDVIDMGDQFGSLANRVDLAHLTVGLHARFNENTTLRVGGVFPLNDIDRAFDAEVQVSLNRYF